MMIQFRIVSLTKIIENGSEGDFMEKRKTKFNEFGCDKAPKGLLLKAAREHYAEMKNSKDFDVYNAGIAKRFGADYAKEFIAAKAKVV